MAKMRYRFLSKDHSLAMRFADDGQHVVMWSQRDNKPVEKQANPHELQIWEEEGSPQPGEFEPPYGPPSGSEPDRFRVPTSPMASINEMEAQMHFNDAAYQQLDRVIADLPSIHTVEGTCERLKEAIEALCAIIEHRKL